MGLAYDVLVASVITAFTLVYQYIAIELMAPNTPLYTIATDGTGVMNGTELAWFWAQLFTVWIPLAVLGGIWAWVAINMFRRQIATGQGQIRAR